MGNGAVILLGAVVCAALAWAADRRRREYADQATTPAAAVFAGRNEVKGRAWTATPLSTHRTGTATVIWDYDLEEQRRHTRTVTSRDAKGNTSTRTETYYQWHSIDQKGASLPVVEVVDETGSVPVQIASARIVSRQLYCEEFRRDGDDGRGFFDKMFDNRTGLYRETETGIAVGDQLFVVGEAELDEATSVPVLRRDVLVSTKGEEYHSGLWGFGTAAATLLALAGGGAGSAFLISPDDPGQPAAWLPGVAAGLVLLLGAWSVTLYNRLHLLAEAVVRAWSLIDVQLKRRHDLIPALAKVVSAHAEYEADLLESLATARTAAAQTQMQAMGATDTAGTAATATAAALAEEATAQTSDLRQILARAEAHSELTADESFLRLQRELADTENRIAGSRTFYNDTLTLLRNKVDGFPGNLVAGRLGLAHRELLPEAGFERTVPELAPAFTSEAAAAPRSS